MASDVPRPQRLFNSAGHDEVFHTRWDDQKQHDGRRKHQGDENVHVSEHEDDLTVLVGHVAVSTSGVRGVLDDSGRPDGKVVQDGGDDGQYKHGESSTRHSTQFGGFCQGEIEEEVLSSYTDDQPGGQKTVKKKNMK